MAQYNLACCYAGGIGIEKDEELAEKWFELAKDNGYAE